MTTIILCDNKLYADTRITTRGAPANYSDEGKKIFVSSDGQFAWALGGSESVTETSVKEWEEIVRVMLEALAIFPHSGWGLPFGKVFGAKAEELYSIAKPGLCFIATANNQYLMNYDHSSLQNLDLCTINNVTGHKSALAGSRALFGMILAGATPEQAYADVGFFDRCTGTDPVCINLLTLSPFVIHGGARG